MIDELHALIDRLSGRTVAVLGDYMLDRYIVGEVSRISPEAPVPVVRARQETYVPGGAGNVVRNLASIGVNPLVCGVIGDDREGERLAEQLEKLGADLGPLVRTPNRGTTTKTRVIGNRQQICRVDFDHDGEANGPLYEELVEQTIDCLARVDAIVLSDYSKGVLSAPLSTAVIERAKKLNVLVCVDPKPMHIPRFRGATLISPNEAEATEATHISIESDETAMEAASALQKQADLEAALVTRGARGMCLYQRDGTAYIIPAVAAEVFDVTGAGDTAVSVVTACLAAGGSFLQAAVIANVAGGEVVQHIGCATVGNEQLHELVEDRVELLDRIDVIQ